MSNLIKKTTMTIGKIRIRLNDGSHHTLKRAEELSKIDSTRKAVFVYGPNEVYIGYSDGVTDRDGMFRVTTIFDHDSRPMSSVSLIGWAYLK